MSISSPASPLWPKISARIAGLRRLGLSRVRRIPHAPGMSIALYIIGTIISLLGILLIVPTLSRIAQASDPIMLLSAPFVMNGVWLFVFGTVLCALARIIHLLDRTPPGAASIDAEEADAKVVIRCPGCTQQLRIDRGRRGIISCPKCGSKFPAQQAVS